MRYTVPCYIALCVNLVSCRSSKKQSPMLQSYLNTETSITERIAMGGGKHELGDAQLNEAERASTQKADKAVGDYETKWNQGASRWGGKRRLRVWRVAVDCGWLNFFIICKYEKPGYRMVGWWEIQKWSSVSSFLIIVVGESDNCYINGINTKCFDWKLSSWLSAASLWDLGLYILLRLLPIQPKIHSLYWKNN